MASLGGRGGCEIDLRKEQRQRETRIETDRAWAAKRCPHPQLFLAPVNPPLSPEGTSPLLLPGTPPTGATCDASDLADPGLLWACQCRDLVSPGAQRGWAALLRLLLSLDQQSQIRSALAPGQRGNSNTFQYFIIARQTQGSQVRGRA